MSLNTTTLGAGSTRPTQVQRCVKIARWFRECVLGKSPEAKPLPVFLLGGRESVRNVHRALKGVADRKGKAAPLDILGTYTAVALPEFGQLEAEGDLRLLFADAGWHSVKSSNTAHAILAVPSECDTETERIFGDSTLPGKRLLVAPQIDLDEMTVESYWLEGNTLALHVGRSVGWREPSNVKRLFDLVAALTLIFFGAPLFLLMSLVIYIDSPGPILYRQRRIGKGNRVFTALKFRTMFTDAHERLQECLTRDPALRKEWQDDRKLRNDPRVTRVGRFLRRFSMDELPQVWNILVRDMSLVGPRPIVVSEIEKYGLSYSAYERVLPGLTGLWQVSGRNDTTYRQRVFLDAYYVRKWSFCLDAAIIARTLPAVLSGRGAY